MRNYIQPGDVITVTAPVGGATGGNGVLLDALFGVAVHDAAEGEDLAIQTTGVIDLAKASGAVTVGARVYWDPVAGNVTTTAAGNTLIGVAVAAADVAAAVARVRLNGSVGP